MTKLWTAPWTLWPGQCPCSPGVRPVSTTRESTEVLRSSPEQCPCSPGARPVSTTRASTEVLRSSPAGFAGSDNSPGSHRPGPSTSTYSRPRGAHRGRCDLVRLPCDWISMLSLIVFLPLAVALVVAAVPAIGPATSRWVWVAVSVVELVLVGVLWAGYEDPGPNALAFEEQVPWCPE